MGRHPAETLKLIARYYLANGKDKKLVRSLLDQYILMCDPSASLVLWEQTADLALTNALKRPALQVNEIIITKPEMETIDGIKGKQGKRLGLTLLCLAKYWDICRENNNHWLTNKNTDIMAMANISASIKKQGALYRQLEDDGLLHFPARVDSISMQVLYVQDGEPELSVKDFRNIGYQYLKYNGEPFYECEECGITSKLKNPGIGRPPKYCPSCAAKIQTQQKVNYVMKHRFA